MDLSQVSRTAFATLAARVVESGRKNPVFNDPMAVLCLNRLLEIASPEERNLILRLERLYAGTQAHHARPVVQRAMAFDAAASRFIAENPGCTVVYLASGFDTRFWRIDRRDCRYVELDLPEVVAVKREVLKDHLDYDLIGCSVQDQAWMEQVAAQSDRNCLFIAEGLMMYLPHPDVVGLLQGLAQHFAQSQFTFDVGPVSYTRGFLRAMIALETRTMWGLETTYVFGVDDPLELETFAPGIRVVKAVKAGLGMGKIITLAINAA